MGNRRKQQAFVAVLRQIRENHPGWQVCRIVEYAVRHSAPSYYTDVKNVASELNSMIGKFGIPDSSVSRGRLRMLHELVSRLGAQNGIRAKAGKDGLLFRRNVLAYILKCCPASSFFYTYQYARRLFYKNFNKIK